MATDLTPLTLCDLDRRLVHERELLDARLRLIEQQLGAAQHALALQAAEYERRLAELNHAYAQAVKERERVVPRELYDLHLKDESSRTAVTERELADLRQTVSQIQTRGATWLIAVTVFMAALTVALRYLGLP